MQLPKVTEDFAEGSQISRNREVYIDSGGVVFVRANKVINQSRRVNQLSG